MKTFLGIKPDAVERNLIGEIIKRVEEKGLKIVGMKMIWLDNKKAEKHYEEHKEKEFFDELVNFITSKPIVALAIKGDEAVSVVRNMIGATDPKESQAGTIRGDFALDLTKNIVHAADSKETAERELDLYFNEEEIYDY